MSKTSVIRHPEKAQFVVVYAWQIEACDGNRCAAMLLSVFENFHNHKLAVQKQSRRQNNLARYSGSRQRQDDSLLMNFTADDLVGYILSYFGEKKVRSSLRLLETKGFISRHRNPLRFYDTRLNVDPNPFFALHPEQVNAWIDEHYSTSNDAQDDAQESAEIPTSDRNGQKAVAEMPQRQKDRPATAFSPPRNGQKAVAASLYVPTHKTNTIPNTPQNQTETPSVKSAQNSVDGCASWPLRGGGVVDEFLNGESNGSAVEEAVTEQAVTEQLITEMTEAGVWPEKATELVENFDVELCQAWLDYANQQTNVYSKGALISAKVPLGHFPAGYRTHQKRAQDSQQAAQKRAEAARAAKVTQERQEAEESALQRENAALDAWLEQLDDSERREVDAQVTKRLGFVGMQKPAPGARTAFSRAYLRERLQSGAWNPDEFGLGEDVLQVLAALGGVGESEAKNN